VDIGAGSRHTSGAFGDGEDAVKARVEVSFRPGVLDPEAQAIHRALASLGFDGVGGVRRAKVIELDLRAGDRASAEAQLRSMCEQLLANPVIETYRVSLSE
jgi:phosphoribosylformylglycinamidine synthase subunit PurS